MAEGVGTVPVRVLLALPGGEPMQVGVIAVDWEAELRPALAEAFAQAALVLAGQT